MRNETRQPSGSFNRLPWPARRSSLAIAALVGALLPAAAIAIPAMSHDTAEAGPLDAPLSLMAKLARRDLRPPSLRLAKDVPVEAAAVDRLREPARAAQEQLSIALGELRQMNALTVDPHYVPALVAVGRAFVDVSGQDPLTRTTVNPEYLGLDSELAASASQLQQSGDEAGALSRGVKRLGRLLARTRRRAHRLERALSAQAHAAIRARGR